MSNKIIAIDFDGTIVTHAYPHLGRPVPSAIRIMKRLQEQGVQLILWTMRSGQQLDEAVRYCEEQGITFWGINQNPAQAEWTDSPKAYAPIYIDDAALGCPTLWDEATQRNMVNWREVEAVLTRKGVLL